MRLRVHGPHQRQNPNTNRNPHPNPNPNHRPHPTVGGPGKESGIVAHNWRATPVEPERGEGIDEENEEGGKEGEAEMETEEGDEAGKEREEGEEEGEEGEEEEEDEEEDTGPEAQRLLARLLCQSAGRGPEAHALLKDMEYTHCLAHEVGDDTIRYDTIRYDTIRYDTIRYDTIRYETIRNETIQPPVPLWPPLPQPLASRFPDGHSSPHPRPSRPNKPRQHLNLFQLTSCDFLAKAKLGPEALPGSAAPSDDGSDIPTGLNGSASG